LRFAVPECAKFILLAELATGLRERGATVFCRSGSAIWRPLLARNEAEKFNRKEHRDRCAARDLSDGRDVTNFVGFRDGYAASAHYAVTNFCR
jgi:hypothetical protein